MLSSMTNLSHTVSPYMYEDAVNLLSIHVVVVRCLNNLMEALFTVEEMGTHCFREDSKTTKPELDFSGVLRCGTIQFL